MCVTQPDFEIHMGFKSPVVWVQLQSAEPWRESAEATPPLLHKSVFTAKMYWYSTCHVSKFHQILPCTFLDQQQVQ